MSLKQFAKQAIVLIFLLLVWLLAIGLLMPDLSAAPFTTINAPPAGEGDTLAIVAEFCPECVRVSDDLDIDFSAATGYYVFAFEDRWRYSDRDFNDLIVEAWFSAGVLVDWAEIASYSAAAQSFGYDGANPFTAATGDPWVATSYSNPARNLCNCDLMATWRLPADTTEVPEPSPMLAVLGCLVVAWWTWRGRR